MSVPSGSPAPSPGLTTPGSPSSKARRVDPSASYLLARLGIIESRVRTLISQRRSDDPSPDDPFRGLYISDEHIDLVLANGPTLRVIDWDDGSRFESLEAEAQSVEAEGRTLRLRELARRAGLADLDIDLLLVALAPDLDPRFERLYGYLNDDVTRRRASVSLGLDLAGGSPWSAAARARLTPDGALVPAGLVVVEDPERPFLSRTLRVPDRVVAHLLGDDNPDPAIAEVLRDPADMAPNELSHSLARVLGEGLPLAYIRERAGSSAPAVAAAALAEAGLAAVVADLTHASSWEDSSALIALIRREALLRGAGVVAGPVEALLERNPQALRLLAGSPDDAVGLPAILYGRAAWEPGWSYRVPLLLESLAESAGRRLEQWESLLGEDAPGGLAGSDVTSQFLLSVEQVSRAVDAARLQARVEAAPVNFDHIRAGARAQNGAGLERLARRIEPHVGWADLVLAPPAVEALEELAGRARRRNKVLDEWGMRPGGGRGRGITVLFAGDSGTGKTMSAEVIAGDLGLDLYTVNLATVVDKYVGETEKNLERIFTEADGVNAVLLFDEADAIFGKRSEVRDANDRYANIEVAYLLQRMETFDGIAILATNLRANVDDAFARRLDMIIDFPSPDVEQRRVLWDKCLSAGVPRAGDIDLDFCARSFELSGGNIRSVAISAAYLAADSGRPVTMLDLVRAIQQEYRKLGRLVVPGEFGAYYGLINAS